MGIRLSDSNLAASPLASIGYRLTLLYIVLLVARVPEITALYLGTSFYQILILNIVLTALALISGILVKVGVTQGGAIWLAFHLWILFTLPFSGYRRGSVEQLQNTLIFLPGLFFVAGFLTRNSDILRKGIWALASAGFIGLAFIQAYGVQMDEDRLVAVGSFSNSNVLAIYLLTMIPVWCYIILDKRNAWFFRLLFSGAVLLALSLILKTGSRSGFMSIGVLAMLAFFTANLANKAKMIVFGGIGIFLAMGAMSDALSSRLGTLFHSNPKDEVAAGAMGSSDERYKLLVDSIDATLKHPLVGSGFGVYSVVNATEKENKGEHATWQVTHNMYTQISSEIGLPGFILYMVGVASSIRALLRVRKIARTNPNARELGAIASAILCSWAMFLFNGFFTSMALDFMLYILTGFSIGIALVCEDLLRRQSESARFDNYSAPLRSPRFFPTAPGSMVPAMERSAGFMVPTSAAAADKNADAPWRRNPRKHPPLPGTPAR